jgi:cyclic pyranopterin phosphate synthase
MREGSASGMAGGAAAGRLEMIDVAGKAMTRRRATARGLIRMSRAAFEAIRLGTNPKGDVLAQAEVAGILAAKRTSEVIPLCHPLALDHVRVRFALDVEGCSVVATSEVSTTARTGVEMEALSGVTGALLAVYDLAKAIDPALTISDVHVSTKEGGKSGHWANPLHAHAEGLP